MMGVATRGVKFKFSTGEHVLCYEPDPTKARVLYDSKVLRVETGHDERGRKIAEYLVHFSGWNSSWDRFVREEFILPCTEENQVLQTKLAKDAALSIKGKRKLPRIIKESLAKDLSTDDDSEGNHRAASSRQSSETESSEEETDREVVIEIPAVLKFILENDWRCISKRNMVIQLPCNPSVISVLEAFVKHFASKLLCTAPPKITKIYKPPTTEEIQNKLNLCKETMDGLRQYFDFTLPHLLLYNEEKKQYYTDGIKLAALIPTKNEESQEAFRNVALKLENDFSDSTSDFIISSKNEISSLSIKKEIHSPTLRKKLVSKTKQPFSQRRKQGRPRLLRNLSPVIQVKAEAVANNVSKHRKIKKRTRKAIKTPPLSPKIKLRCVRILRSRKSELQTPVTNDHFAAECHIKPTLNRTNPQETTNSICEVRQTRNSAFQNAKPSRNRTSDRPLTLSSRYLRDKSFSIHPSSAHQNTESSIKTEPFIKTEPSASSHHVSTRTEPFGLNFGLNSESSGHLHSLFANRVPSSSLTSNSISSSNSSSHSVFTSRLSQNHFFNNASILQDVMTWHMLPVEQYNQVPAAPSLIYGPIHLLRLFVKLPELISKMGMPGRKLDPLLSILDKFLMYMVEKQEILFPDSSYVELQEDIFEGNSIHLK